MKKLSTIITILALNWKLLFILFYFTFFFEPTTNSKLLFLSFLLAPTVDGNNSPQNVPIPVTRNTNQIPVLTANAVTASIPVVTNHIPNGGVHVPHVRPRLPGGFPVRDSTISITPSDGIYGGGGLQSTQKGKYGNRDMKAELKDLEVDMDRITLGDLLEEGEEYLSIRLSWTERETSSENELLLGSTVPLTFFPVGYPFNLDHRWRKLVVRTKKWHTSRIRVCL